MIGNIPVFTSNSLATLSYLKQPDTILFYQLNRCIPDLFLSTQIVLDNIRNSIETFSEQDKEYFDSLNKLSLAIDKSIHENLEEMTEKLMKDTNSEKFLSIYYC